MKLLLFSDVHRDLAAARQLVDSSAEVDAVLCAGDLAVMRNGLQEVVDVLAGIEVPTVLVPGNGESDAELAEACRDWPHAIVLHGGGAEVDGRTFWGVGGAIPVTPFGAWSFDLTEDEARTKLAGCPPGAVLVLHSPPFGHVDVGAGGHFGSKAVLETVERVQGPLAVCGHIHDCWRMESTVGATRVVNAGPGGVIVEIE